jgi:predicted RNA-binding Zn-ribbon protein involved in translation (DUF1610 family)
MDSSEKGCWLVLGGAFLLYVGPDIVAAGRDAWLVIVIALGFYFVGSFLHSIVSGNKELGSSSTTYSCEGCGFEFNWLADIAGKKGEIVNCPNCGTANRV